MNEKESLHTRYPDLFPDDEAVDPAFARLIDELETVYAAVKRPANLSEQLVSTLQSHLELADPAAAALPAASFPDPPTPMRLPHERHRRGWQRGLGTLAAAVLITLIAGSLLLVLHQAHQSGLSRNGTATSRTAGLNRFVSIHMLDTTTGWAQITDGLIARFVVLRTTDGGSHWQDVTPPQLTTPVDDNHGNLYALNATTAWVTDVLPLQYPQPEKFRGTLFRTTDAGRTWQNITLPPPISDAFWINDVNFLNAQIGWISIVSRTGKGGGQMQYDRWHTSDGGQTWSHITIPNPAGEQGFSSITFVDEKTWWLTAMPFNNSRPVIYVTHDAGSTLHKHVLPVPAGVSFSSLSEVAQFFSDRDGILVVSDGGGDIVVYVTHDGGDTWQPTTPNLLHRDCRKGCYSHGIPVFADMNHGWIYEEVIPFAGTKLPTMNRLIITTDGGQHWTTIEIQMPGGQKGQTVSLDNVGSSWLNPDFVSAKVGWLMGYYSPSTSDLPRSALFKTVDGGHTWTVVHYSIS